MGFLTSLFSPKTPSYQPPPPSANPATPANAAGSAAAARTKNAAAAALASGASGDYTTGAGLTKPPQTASQTLLGG